MMGTLPVAFSQKRSDPLVAPEPAATVPGVIPSASQSPGVTPEPDSLFVPIVPGATPSATPKPPEKVFIPSEIPAPAIQATPETQDTIDASDSNPQRDLLDASARSMTLRATPTPVPRVKLSPYTYPEAAATPVPAATRTVSPAAG